MPPSIEEKDYDFERDILICKDFPRNNTLSFAKKESFHFDIPLFSRLPAKPPDGDTGILNIKMMGDISDQKAFMHKLMITLASHQEKSHDLLSHRCRTIKKFNTHHDNIISGLPSFSAITPDEPVLSTEEPDNSLSMGDEHLDTIPATKSDQFIKSGVETLIPIPSESEGIPDHTCDVPSHDNSPPLDVSKDTSEDLSESNKEFSSTDDDSFSLDKIDYVEASPPDSELVSPEVMEIVIPKVGGIKASNDNPIPSYDPIIPGTPPNLTPSGESDFFLEVDAFLAVEDEPTLSQFPKSYLDPEGDMLLFEAFLNDYHSFDF
nr:hypothetical protein [Tanacetum cinerariifolium]